MRCVNANNDLYIETQAAVIGKSNACGATESVTIYRKKSEIEEETEIV